MTERDAAGRTRPGKAGSFSARRKVKKTERRNFMTSRKNPSPAEPQPAIVTGNFKNGQTYEFKKKTGGRCLKKEEHEGHKFIFIRCVPGARRTLFLFRTLRSGCNETFTQEQLSDYEIREAKE
jgi:hypothetical protein